MKNKRGNSAASVPLIGWWKTGGMLVSVFVIFFCCLSGVLKAQAIQQGSVAISGGPSYPGGRWDPEEAVDNALATYWAGDPKAEAWQLVLDLKEARDIKDVTVTYFGTSHMPATATILASLDGNKWDEVGKLPSQTPAVLALGRQARYVKLEMQGKASGKQPAIREIIFNAQAKAATPDAATGGNTPQTTPTTSQSAKSQPAKAQESLPGSIVASGGPDYPGGRWGPERAVDHNFETYWAGDPKAEAWQLALDLKELQEVTDMTVTYFSATHMPQTATVSASLDGNKWDEVGKLPGQTPAVLTLGRQVRYVKLEMQGKASGKQPAIREITFNKRRNAATGGATTGSTATGAAVSEGTPSASMSAISGWPAGVERIDYPSAADNTTQPSLFYNPKLDQPVPLLVALHTWSGDWRQSGGETVYAKWCIDHGWAMLHPHFRGPNSTHQACGSELAVQDILSAVEYAQDPGD